MLGKGSRTTRNQIWQIAAYSNFSRVTEKAGPSSNAGVVVADTFVFNDKGRIQSIDGEWLSQPIHQRLSGTTVGGLSIAGEYSTADSRMTFSSGKTVFNYYPTYKTWEEYLYNKELQIYSVLTPGIPWESWIGPLKKHCLLSFREEDTISDNIFIYDNSKLCVSNHFSDDDESKIVARYETRTDACGSPSTAKRFQQIVLYGKYYENYYYTDDNINTYTVYGSFTSTPDVPSWQKIGDVTLDSNGHGSIWLDKRGIWAAVAVEVKSKNPWRLERIGVRYVGQTQR